MLNNYVLIQNCLKCQTARKRRSLIFSQHATCSCQVVIPYNIFARGILAFNKKFSLYAKLLMFLLYININLCWALGMFVKSKRLSHEKWHFYYQYFILKSATLKAKWNLLSFLPEIKCQIAIYLQPGFSLNKWNTIEFSRISALSASLFKVRN